MIVSRESLGVPVVEYVSGSTMVRWYPATWRRPGRWVAYYCDGGLWVITAKGAQP